MNKDKLKGKHENLYSLKFTSAGPVIVKILDADLEDWNDPVIEVVEKNLFTYLEARDVVCNWFKERADKIDSISEDKYYTIGGLISEEKSFQESLLG